MQWFGVAKCAPLMLGTHFAMNSIKESDLHALYSLYYLTSVALCRLGRDPTAIYQLTLQSTN